MIAPVFLLTLLYLLLGESSYTPVVALNSIPAPVAAALKEQSSINVIIKDSDESDEDFIKNGHADTVISQNADGMHLIMLEQDSVKINAVTKAIKAAQAALKPAKQFNYQLHLWQCR